MKSSDLAGLAGMVLSLTGFVAALRIRLSQSSLGQSQIMGGTSSVHRRKAPPLSARPSALALSGQSNAARRLFTQEDSYRMARAVQVGVRKSRARQSGSSYPRVRAMPKREHAYIGSLYDKATGTVDGDVVEDWT